MDSKPPFGPQVTLPKTETPQAPQSVEPAPPSVEITPKPAPGRLAVEVKNLADKLAPGLSSQQRDAMSAWSKRARAGVFTQAIMICRDEDCPFINQCPLKHPPKGADGSLTPEIPRPVGEECPVETHLAEGWISDFLQAFAVREDDPDFHLVKLALGDIILDILQQLRISWYISSCPNPVVSDFIGLNADGDPIFVQKISPALEHLSKVGMAKLKHLRELLGTPRAKVEARRRGWQDPASRAADALARASKLKRLRSQQETTISISNPKDVELPGSASGPKPGIPEVESVPDDTIDVDD